MPEVKEIHYFDERMHQKGGPIQRLRGDNPEDIRWRRQARAQIKRYPEKLSLGRLKWDANFFLREPDDAWYASLFRPGEGKIVGEATPDYSVLGPGAISHVREIMPGAKIIFMMRNPVERAWSATAMTFRNLGRAMETMTDEELDAHLGGRRVRLFTDYLKTLENWGAHFPPEQIFVGFLEDVHLYPEEFMARLYGFLGADPDMPYRVIRQKVHSGSNESIPVRSASYLFGAYRDEIRELHRRFGGYASFWNHCAERLEGSPAEGTLPYPFWETPMWGEWLGGREPRFQSGALSSLLPADDGVSTDAAGPTARAIAVPDNRTRKAARSGARFPDFIGIGAQKAGTTWLYHNLRAHPQIWIPKKEVHYFDQKVGGTSFNLASRLFGGGKANERWRKEVRHWVEVNLRKRSLSGLVWVYKFYMRSPSDDWYASLFEPRKGRVAGEITPNYSVLGRDAVSHVHGLMPEAKILFMMRNPVERAWSQAVMYFDKIERQSVGGVSEEQIRKFVSTQSSLLTNYLRTLENWRAYYPDEQIFVGFMEDVHFQPEGLLSSVCEFLGVDPSFKPPGLKRKFNSRSADEMPTKLAVHLARTYLDNTRLLAERFGGYASFWLYCAEQLSNDPPPGDFMPYPLWNSSLWNDWVEGSGSFVEMTPGHTWLQSGPLSKERFRDERYR